MTGARQTPREISYPSLKKSSDEGASLGLTAEQLDKRDQQNLERREFEEKKRSVVGRMRAEDVQQEFLSMSDLANGET